MRKYPKWEEIFENSQGEETPVSRKASQPSRRDQDSAGSEKRSKMSDGGYTTPGTLVADDVGGSSSRPIG